MYSMWRQKFWTLLLPKNQPQLYGNIERVDLIHISSKKFDGENENEKSSVTDKSGTTTKVTTTTSDSIGTSEKENAIATEPALSDAGFLKAEQSENVQSPTTHSINKETVIAPELKTEQSENVPSLITHSINKETAIADESKTEQFENVQSPITHSINKETVIAAESKTERYEKLPSSTSHSINKDNSIAVESTFPIGCIKSDKSEKGQTSNSPSDLLLNTLTMIATSNEVKLVKLSAIKAYKWSNNKIQQHVLDNPKVKTYTAEFKKKIESQDKKT